MKVYGHLRLPADESSRDAYEAESRARLAAYAAELPRGAAVEVVVEPAATRDREFARRDRAARPALEAGDVLVILDSARASRGLGRRARAGPAPGRVGR